MPLRIGYKLLNLLAFMAGCIHSSNAQPTPHWQIEATHIDPLNYYGATVGNGMLGLVSSPTPLQNKMVVLAGAYDSYGRGRVSNFLPNFNFLNLYIAIDGQRVTEKNVTHFTQTLDMKRAIMVSQFTIANKAVITTQCLALRQLPFSAMLDVTIRPLKKIAIEVGNPLEAPDALKNVENYYNEIVRPHTHIALLTSTAQSPTGKLTLCASTSFLFDALHHPTLIQEMWDNNMHLTKFFDTLPANSEYNFAVVGSTITSAHNPDPLNEAERLTIFAALKGKHQLLKEHIQAWKTLWQSDIEIEGNDSIQQDVHSMLYHLYSFVRADYDLSPSPMGLSGLGYNGHVFWDAELWMFPALLVLHPEMAASMLNYRFNRLEIAKKNALEKGYKGAMYPWESAQTGLEETPVWALSGPFEHHITACVGIAAWQYFCVTQDTLWLKEKGYPLLNETANFWLSRVEPDAQGLQHIKNVVAADEWAENVDDNAFTNAAAKANLHFATQAALVLGKTPNPEWEQVRKQIPILKFANGITQEYQGYAGEHIKQADVNLLSYPLKETTEPQAIQKELEYYSQRVPTQGTPAMTQAIFSLLYAQLGNANKALFWFKDAYQPNMLPPFNVLAETKGGTNPYFATGAGGLLQAVLMGFLGLEITPQGLVQQKNKGLPTSIKAIKATGVGVHKQTFEVNHN